MSPVVVTDGDERAALAVVRSLGRRGEEVIVCSPSGRSLAGASRYAAAEEAVSGFPSDADTYLEAVRDVVRRRHADVLLPISEASLRMLLPHRERLAPTALPFPPAETFARASDKQQLTHIAKRLGIPVPDHASVSTSSRFNGLLPEDFKPAFPLVVKPSRSFVQTAEGGKKLTVQHARDARELRRAIRSYPDAGFPLLVQQRIVGPGVGIFLLVWEGQPRAVFAHRRIREKPPSGGVSVCRESVDPDPSMVAMALRLLRELEWQGVAMVEFKMDERTGTPYLMEVNGRFWGSLQLAVDSGVDFPRLLVDASRGLEADGIVTGNGYVRSRWFWGEIDHLIARARGNGANGHGQPDGRARFGGDPFRAAADLLRWKSGDRMEVFRWSDGRPFLRESAGWLRDATQRDRPRAEEDRSGTEGPGQ